MRVNDITVPDEGVTTAYYTDKIGGWMYIVRTDVTVQMKNLNDIQGVVDEAQRTIEEKQALIDELVPLTVELKDSPIPANPKK